MLSDLNVLDVISKEKRNEEEGTMYRFWTSNHMFVVSYEGFYIYMSSLMHQYNGIREYNIV